jgi:lysophospholipase L1-like esterase
VTPRRTRSLVRRTTTEHRERTVNRRLVAAVSALTGVLTASLLSPASSQADESGPVAPASVKTPLAYVALGDSYSAASGVLPPDPAAAPQCLRSTRNYPHVIAEATGAALTDVTCSGAETGDYFEPQHDGVAPQLDALSRRTRLVTMTIGGNDSGVFVDSMVQCGAAGLTTAGRGSPCQDRYGSSFADTVRDTTYPSLVRALRAVRQNAPRARVAILGYPWILPKRVGCFDKMPIARGDVPYLRGLQWVLNDAVRRAAERTGVTYVNLNRVSEGHDACQPLGERWIEPVLQGTNPVVVHPNALGERRMAAQAMTVLRLR